MNPESQQLSPLVKLSIVFGTIAVLAGSYFAFTVLGETRFNITLTTNPDLERGLIAHYTFDAPDLDPNIRDRAGGNHGTLFTTAATTSATSTSARPGRIGQGFEFFGLRGVTGTSTDTYRAFVSATTTDDGLDASGNFTLSAWVKPASASGNPIIAKGSNYQLEIDKDRKLKFVNMNVSSPTFTFHDAMADVFEAAYNVPVDFDGDGDMDVVTAGGGSSDQFAWHENDGSDTSFTSHVIESGATNADEARKIYPVDFDGDGDVDVVTAADASDEFAWYENDGTNTSFTRRPIATGAGNADGAFHIYPVDFDGDGDIDVVTAAAADFTTGEFVWHENDGTNTSFTRRAIETGATNASGASVIFPVDFDGDGDIDVVTAAFSSDEFAWYENDGTNTSFTRRAIATGTNADGALGIFPVDFDNDGDTDVVTAAQNADEFAWYENDGTDTSFTRRVIDSGAGAADGTRNIFPVDFDGDGDMDVVGALFVENQFNWYENDGSDTSFTRRAISSTIDSGASRIFPVDFDGDGDIDVVTAAFNSNELAWYETSSSAEAATSTTAVPTNEWSHVLVSYDGTNINFYIDGILSNSVAMSAPTVSNASLNIGRSVRWWDNNKVRDENIATTKDHTFDGVLDDVRIYNRELSAGEVRRLYQLGATTRINVTLNNNPDLEDGLVGHWTFDGLEVDLGQVTAEARDRSGQGNHGDWQNHASTTGPGKIGQALEFDGSNDYIEIANESNFDFERTDTMSVCAWFNTRTITPAVQTIVAKLVDVSPFNGWEFGLFDGSNSDPDANSNRIFFNQSNTNNTSELSVVGPEIVPNRWYHACATYNGNSSPSGIKIYYDGSEQSTITDWDNLSGSTLNNVPVNIGFRVNNGDSDWPFDGYLDDVRVYNRALSAEEVKRLYQLGATTRINVTLDNNPALRSGLIGLIGHWTMDGLDVDLGQVTAEVRDRAGSNHGDWQNHASTTRPGKIGQALEFDGIDDFVDGGNLGSANTVAFWMKPNSLTENVIDLNSAGTGGAADWYDSNYTYCRPFTMTAGGDSGGVATTTTNGFALVATSTITDLKHTDNGGKIQLLQEDDANTPNKVPTDVVFTNGTDCNDDGGTKIDFFFEEYASTTGAFTAWVEPTDISSTTAKTVLVYYGNSSATDQSNEAGVFGALDEVGVWNLHEDPGLAGAGGIKDSTSDNNDGTDNGSMTSGDLVDGQVDGALDFDAVDDYVDAGTPTITITNPWTAIGWAKYDTGSDDFAGFFGLRDAATNERIFIGNDSGNNLKVVSNGETSGSGSSLPTDWAHVGIRYDGSDFEAILNAVIDYSVTPSGSDWQSSDTFEIGRQSGINRYILGSIDDVRLYARFLHAMDIKTIYNNTLDSTTFWTIGAEETENLASGNNASIALSSSNITVNGFTAPVTYVDGAETSTIPDTGWHHVVITDTNATTSDQVRLGRIGDNYFSGRLDDVRIYDRALSADEVERLYELGR